MLFNETIRTNIDYRKKGDVNEDKIAAAAEASNAHNFMSSLPQGYDTSVGK
uniref:Multidrug resistance protein 1 2 n=1 Tax=Rhizophora mucronata TaxID=61149 RepID=A0A2P2MWX4_RHIMU